MTRSAALFVCGLLGFSGIGVFRASALDVNLLFEGGTVKHITYYGSSGELQRPGNGVTFEWFKLKQVDPFGAEQLRVWVQPQEPSATSLEIKGEERLADQPDGVHRFIFVTSVRFPNASAPEGFTRQVISSDPQDVSFSGRLGGRLLFNESLSNTELAATGMVRDPVYLNGHGLSLLAYQELPPAGATFRFVLQGGEVLSVNGCEFKSPVRLAAESIVPGTPPLVTLLSSKFVQLDLAQLPVLDFDACTVEGPLTAIGCDELRATQSTFDAVDADHLGQLVMEASQLGRLTVSLSQEISLTDCVTGLLQLGPGQANRNISIQGCSLGGGQSQLAALESCTAGNSMFHQGLIATMLPGWAEPVLTGCVFPRTLYLHWASGRSVPKQISSINGCSFLARDAVRLSRDGDDISLKTEVPIPGNYWGGDGGPRGTLFNGRQGGWLDNFGGLYAHVPRQGQDCLKTGSFAAPGGPFPELWVEDYRLGQNTLTHPHRGGVLAREGREVLVCYDIRSTAGQLSGVEFWIDILGDSRKIYPTEGSYTIRRDHGKPRLREAAARTLNFIIPADRVGADALNVGLRADASAVADYSTPGPAGDSSLIHAFSFTPWSAPSQPLRIGVLDVRNSLPGYKFSAAYTSRAEVLKDNLERDLLAMLPLKTGELEIEVLAPYRYGKKYSALLGSLLNPVAPTVSWSLLSELESHLTSVNAGRAKKLRCLLAVVPQDTLSPSTSGETAEGYRVAAVREDRLWSAAHELLHMLRLYETGAEQYELTENIDVYGNLIEPGGGAIASGITWFVPGDAQSGCSTPSGGVAHVAFGVNSGIYDIMGNSPTCWPVVSTLQQVYPNLGLSPPPVKTLTGGLSPRADTPPALTPFEAPPGTRRVLFTGVVALDERVGEYRLVTGSVFCRDVTTVMMDPVTPAGSPVFSAKMIAFDSSLSRIREEYCRLPAGRPGSGPALWEQTFDIPMEAFLYHLRDEDTGSNERFFAAADAGQPLTGELTGPSAGSEIGQAVAFVASGGGSPAALNQLFAQVKPDSEWVPVSEVFTGTQEVLLSSADLPETDWLAVKLLTSDGFRRHEVGIENLRVGNRPPEALILEPYENAYASSGADWTLEARAWDPEEGLEIHTSWDSSLDGALGTEPRIDRVTLSEGIHLLTFTAADSSGNTVTDTRNVTVGSGTEVDLRVNNDQLSVTTAGRPAYSTFPNRLAIGSENQVSAHLRLPALAEPIRARAMVEGPDQPIHTVLDVEVSGQDGLEQTLGFGFTPTTRGRHAITVQLDAPAGYTERTPADNRYTWEFEDEPPTAFSQRVRTAPQVWINIPIEAEDPNADPVTFVVTTPPALGTLIGSPPELIYASGAVSGLDFFEFVADDGVQSSTPARVSIEILPPPAAPAIPYQRVNGVLAGVPFSHRVITFFGATDFIPTNPLPAGWTLDPVSGVLSGVPTATNPLRIPLLAENEAGTGYGEVILDPGASFGWWIENQNVPLEFRGEEADPDGDGIPNLHEFAYGLFPDHADDTGVPFGTVMGGRPAFVFRQRPNGSGAWGLSYRVDGLLYQVEVCHDLTTQLWESDPGVLEYGGLWPDNDPTIETVIMHVRPESGFDDRAFLRLRVVREQ